MPIRPDDYKSSEADIVRQVFGPDAVYWEWGYHTQGLPARIMERLCKPNGPEIDPAAFFIRARADRVVVDGHDRLWMCEIKCKSRGGYQNVALEAFPLAIHRCLARDLRVRTYYVVECPDDLIRMVPSADIQPAELLVPSWRHKETSQLKDYFGGLFPGVPLTFLKTGGGSGDVFVLIRPEIWSQWAVVRYRAEAA